MPNTNNHPWIIDPHTGLSGCTCGNSRILRQTATLYLGADAARVMADDCRAVFVDQPVLLLSDPDVQRVVGHTLEAELRTAGVNLTSFVLDADPVADDQTVAKVRLLSADKALVISVGSGTLNDLGKYSASEDGKPFWVMPTAPSMNGYTSGIAAIKVKGVKTDPSRDPAGAFVCASRGDSKRSPLSFARRVFVMFWPKWCRISTGRPSPCCSVRAIAVCRLP